jgi:SecD/SecF fusion protein
MKTITKTHLLVLLALLLKGCINPFGEWRSKGDYVKMTLEIPVPDLVQHLAGKTNDERFLNALSQAVNKEANTGKDFVTLFGEAYADLNHDLALSEFFHTPEMDGAMESVSTETETLNAIRLKVNQTVDETIATLQRRIIYYGYSSARIGRTSEPGRIQAEFLNVENIETLRQLITNPGYLSFWETYSFDMLYSYFEEADQMLIEIVKAKGLGPEKPQPQPDTISTGSSKLLDAIYEEPHDHNPDDELYSFAQSNPLFAYLRPNFYQNEKGNWFPANSATVGYAQIKDTARINLYLDEVAHIFPERLKLAWKIKPEKWMPGFLELMAIKLPINGATPILDGQSIEDARQDFDMSGRVEIMMVMNKDAARIWERMTANNIGRQIAMMIDDHVISAPNVNDAITGGRSSITGNFDMDEAMGIASMIRSGAIPAKILIVEEEIIDPKAK